jgi:polysaccharide pyruvyl transferase WcaK-like protein
MIAKKKLIEIRGTGFINKGAELMLHSILERVRSELPHAEFAMSPSIDISRPFIKRAKLGLYQKPYIVKYGINFSRLLNIIPERLRHMFGIVMEREVDVILDASGFSYSDQWGNNSCKELELLCRRAKKTNTKFILLPQAFGPFKNSTNRNSFNLILRDADLIFARDKTSYNHLIDISPMASNVKIAGDFTNIVNGVLPVGFNSTENRFALIPNFRMIDKTDLSVSSKYVSFLTHITKYTQDHGMKPFLLIHEGANDLKIAKIIQKSVSNSIEILVEGDPLKIKGILSTVDGVFSSRFHGLVSALSQGKIAIGTGWSHKYQCLFEDYQFLEGMFDVSMQKDDLIQKMDSIFQENNMADAANRISRNANRLKVETNEMWEEVFSLIGSEKNKID